MKAKFQSTFSLVFLFLCMIFLAPPLQFSINAQGTDNKIKYRQISLEDYKDKVAGGWLGQAIGVLYGQYSPFGRVQ